MYQVIKDDLIHYFKGDSMSKYFKVTRNGLIFLYDDKGIKTQVVFYSQSQYNGLLSDGLKEIK